MNANEIVSEIRRVEALIESPEGKGKKTILKAYVRKLYSQYRKVMK